MSGGYYSKIFPSWTSWLEYSRDPRARLCIAPCPSDYLDVGGVGWKGTRNYEGAFKLAAEGWHEGAAAAKPLTDALVERIGSRIARQDVVYGHEGVEIDMGRFCDGEPEHWQSWETSYIEGPGGILRVMAAGSASSAVSADTIERRGSVLSALVQLLEYAGRRVELWTAVCCYGVKRGRADFDYRIQVKASDQPLDMGRVAFALGHPSMLRRLGFHAIATLPDKPGGGLYRARAARGYNFCAPAKLPDLDTWDIGFSEMHSLDRQWAEPGKAETWVLAELKKQGIELKF